MNKVDQFEKKNVAEHDKIAAEFRLPLQPDPKQHWGFDSDATGAAWRKKLHEPAIKYKNRYYEFIGRCGVLLAAIFILLALSLTVFKSEIWLNKYLASIDLLAIIYVMIHWWRSKLAIQAWVLVRVKAELMRQRIYLAFVFSWTENEMARGYENASKQIDENILRPKSKILQWLGFGLTSEQLEKRIEEYWSAFSRDLKAKTLIDQGADLLSRILVYLKYRPINQLRWYRIRHRQLARIGVWRGGIMVGLFLITFVLAAGTTYLIHTNPDKNSYLSDWLNLGLLTTTAISAALTYWYVNRNERSVSHRYVTQRREIENWLRKASKLFEQQTITDTYDQILIFEGLMLSELIDWAHATSHDVMELGA
jgi:hypothetical protein